MKQVEFDELGYIRIYKCVLRLSNDHMHMHHSGQKTLTCNIKLIDLLL